MALERKTSKMSVDNLLYYVIVDPLMWSFIHSYSHPHPHPHSHPLPVLINYSPLYKWRLPFKFFLQTQTQQVGSDPLLEAFLTAAVLDVFRNSTMFGGVLVAHTATLISDVANQDPSTTVAYLLR